MIGVGVTKKSSSYYNETNENIIGVEYTVSWFQSLSNKMVIKKNCLFKVKVKET